jgi:hypothetical protein
MKRIINATMLIALVCAHVQLNAQQSIEDKMKAENVVRGTIIKDGKETEGYLLKTGTTTLISSTDVVPAPWEFQKDIRFIEKSTFAALEKVKLKNFEKYSADDIDGYKYEGDSIMTFESVKYADMSAVGTGMIAKKMFMQKYSEGKISLYLHYSPPISMGEVSAMEQSMRDGAVGSLVYKVGKDGKLKLINNLNVKKELVDCPAVVEKFEKGGYGMQADKGEATGLAKFADQTLNRDVIRLAAILEYNTICK